MIRVANVAERNITPNGGKPVVVPVATATDVIPDQTKGQPIVEIMYRSIMNVGSNPLYYALGQDASPANFHGILAGAGQVDANGFGQGSSLDVSNCRLRLSVYSTAGTTVAVTILYRNDGTSQSAYNPITGSV